MRTFSRSNDGLLRNAFNAGFNGAHMIFKTIYGQIVIVILCAACIAGCNSVQNETALSSTPSISEPSPILPMNSMIPTFTPNPLSPGLGLSGYAFPDLIDPTKQYMFYLHGKIIEDQVIPAISPDYGEYEYGAILKKLSGYGFVVISEQRPKNTDSGEYANKVAGQVRVLLKAGVPAKNITVVGASKGAGITILVSNLLENKGINYVLMAICDPATVEELKQNQVILYGKVLSIYDTKDALAGSCQELFSFSQGKGISRYDELVLNVGTGHGILYKPLDEWILPTVKWANNDVSVTETLVPS